VADREAALGSAAAALELLRAASSGNMAVAGAASDEERQ